MDYSECSFLELTKDERGTSSFLFQLLYPLLHFTSDYNNYPYSLQFSHMNGNFNDEYYKESIYVGYRYFDRLNISPKYCFGYGIGYSTFSIENPQVEIDKENIIVKATVKNTGSKYSGREVVQVYVSAQQGKLTLLALQRA